MGSGFRRNDDGFRLPPERRFNAVALEKRDMPDFLIYEQDGPLVTLTMNQPEQRNPLTGNTAIPEFLSAIDHIHDDRGVRCVILTANGPSFSSGGDIREMKKQAGSDVSE